MNIGFIKGNLETIEIIRDILKSLQDLFFKYK
jgi:hypothetical protein